MIFVVYSSRLNKPVKMSLSELKALIRRVKETAKEVRQQKYRMSRFGSSNWLVSSKPGSDGSYIQFNITPKLTK